MSSPENGNYGSYIVPEQEQSLTDDPDKHHRGWDNAFEDLLRKSNFPKSIPVGDEKWHSVKFFVRVKRINPGVILEYRVVPIDESPPA